MAKCVYCKVNIYSSKSVDCDKCAKKYRGKVPDSKTVNNNLNLIFKQLLKS